MEISRWKKIGKGANGVVYESLDNPDVILKLDLWGRKEKMVHEFECAKRAAAMGIHTPRVYELASDGKRYGYTCQRIWDKKSYCRVIADEPSRLDEMARRFARHAKELHSVECDTEYFQSYQDRALGFINRNKFMKPAIKAKVAELVKSIPSRTSCMLGDFHFGNIITDGLDDWWIDMEQLCYGNPLYDLGVFYFTAFYMPGFVTKYIFHVRKSQAKEFFTKALEYYFQPEDSAQRAEIYRQLDKEVAMCYAGILQHWTLALIYLPRLKRHLKRF